MCCAGFQQSSILHTLNVASEEAEPRTTMNETNVPLFSLEARNLYVDMLLGANATETFMFDSSWPVYFRWNYVHLRITKSSMAVLPLRSFSSCSLS